MNHKQMIVANLRYKKPTVEESNQTRGLLRYYNYRDSGTRHIRQAPGTDRWQDRGMGRIHPRDRRPL